MAELVKETYSSMALCPTQLVQASIKGDVIVPDIKPDAAKVLQTSAYYMPEDAVLENSKVKLQGSLSFTVLYLSQEESPKLCSVTAALPVAEEVNLDGIVKEEDRVKFQVDYHPENIRCTLLNGRKFSLSALLEMEVKVTRYEDTAIIMDVQSEDTLVVSRVERNLRKLIGDKEEKLVVREIAEIPAGSPNVEEVLWWEVDIRDRSHQILEDRVQVKGELAVSILYQTESGVQFIEHSEPFSGLIDVGGTTDGMECRLRMDTLKGEVRMDQDADGEMRLLPIEVVVGCRVQVWQEEKKALLADAYDTQREVVLEKPLCPMLTPIYNGPIRVEIGETLDMPEGMPMALQVFYFTAHPKIDDCTIDDDHMRVEGVLYVTAFCLTADDRSPVISFTDTVPFEKDIEISGAKPGQNAEVSAHMERVKAELKGDQSLQMKAVLQLDVSISQEEMQPVLTELSFEEREEAELPQMAVYYLQPGETAWDVGKRYRIRPENMEKLNDSVLIVVR